MSKYTLVNISNSSKDIENIVEFIMGNFEYLSDKYHHLTDKEIAFKIHLRLVINRLNIDIENRIYELDLNNSKYPEINMTQLKTIIRDEKLDNLLNN